MSKLSIHTVLILCLALMFSSCAAPADAAPMAKKGGIPDWALSGEMAQYPKALYWTAPGSGDNLVSASDKARSEVAAQIKVQIKSVTTSSEAEFSGSDREYYASAFQTTVQSLVDQTIQGIEIAKTQKAGNIYYAYAVLEKDAYLGGLLSELQDYASQLTTLYDDAESLLDKGDIFPGIENLADALEIAPEIYPRQNFYNALTDRNFNLPSHLQGAALLSHIRSTLSSVKLELVSGDKQSSAPGQRLPEAVVVKASMARGTRTVPIAELPLRASYASGDQAGKMSTDMDGMASFPVSAVAGDRPGEGWVRIVPNLGRMPEIMGPELRTLEQIVDYTISGDVASFAVRILDESGNRLSKVEADVEALIVKSGFQVDPKSNLMLNGTVAKPAIRKIEVGGSPTYQAEASLVLEVYDRQEKRSKGSLEVSKKTVNKKESTASRNVLDQVGKSVKRKALTEMLADALAQ